jgi:hypothetical protein
MHGFYDACEVIVGAMMVRTLGGAVVVKSLPKLTKAGWAAL